MRLSGVGYCLRKQIYGHLGVEPSIPEGDTSAMDRGRELEPEIVSRLREDGYTVVDQQREVSLGGVLGHIDGIVTDHRGRATLLEIKTFRSRARWELYQEIGVWDFWDYRAQVTAYGMATGYDTALFVSAYQNKKLTQLVPYVWHLRDEDIVRVCTNIDTVLNATEPSPVYRSHGSPVARECTWCRYRNQCWENTDATY